MPSWRVHAEIARLVGREPRRDLDELIDSFESHDIGRQLPRRLTKKHIERLEKLAQDPGYFYLHHAADLLRDLLAYYLLAGEEPGPPRLLAAQVEYQLGEIRAKLREALEKRDYQGPAAALAEADPSQLPEIHGFLAQVEKTIDLVLPEARRAAKALQEEIDEKPWKSLAQDCLEKARRAAERYREGSEKNFHTRIAKYASKYYIRSRFFTCLADKAALRTRLAPLLIASGHVFAETDNRGVYHTVHELLQEALHGDPDTALQRALERAIPLHYTWRNLDEQDRETVRKRLQRAREAAKKATELLKTAIEEIEQDTAPL